MKDRNDTNRRGSKVPEQSQSTKATFVRGKDWDLFEIAKGEFQVQADDETGTMTDEQAISEARKARYIINEDGYLLETPTI